MKEKLKKKKKSKRYYFTEEVDDAIIRYNERHKSRDRDIDYQIIIYPALDKLSENLINTFKFDYIDLAYEDLKHELVVFLTEKLDKFNKESGKAFSYFSIVGRNYLIAKNKKGYENRKSRVELDIIDAERDVATEITIETYRDDLSAFVESWIEEMDDKIEDMFSDDIDLEIAYAILAIFKDRKLLDAFNKKALYILIREQVGIKTQRITKVLNIMKENFYTGFEEYSY